MAKKNSNELFTSLLYIILGIVLIIFKTQTLGWAMTIAGAFFILSGILDVLKKNITGGIVSIVIGAAILLLGWLATQIVLLVLGILIALKGIIAFVEAFRGKKPNVLQLIFPALSIALGLMLAFGNGLEIIIVICGALLAVDGVLGLLGSLKK